MTNSVTQCVILLGGLGSRLGNLTSQTPKPLLPVGGRPFVDTLIVEAVRRGFRNILLLAGYRSEVVTEYVSSLRNTLPSDVAVTISIEPEPMGTGGALAYAEALLDEAFLLLNGDTWFDFNWRDLIAVAGPCSAIAAREVPEADRYESLLIADDGTVRQIIPRGSGAAPALINGGVYVFRRSDLFGFSGKYSIEEDLLPKMISAGALRSKKYDGFFVDIGIPATYKSAQASIPLRRRRPALFLDRDGVINHDDDYVGSIERVRRMNGAIPLIRLANDLGFYVFVVTNQAGVARGFYTEEDVAVLHKQMAAFIRECGASVDDWRYCPYHPNAAIEAYCQNHPWRKPQPGMLLDLMAHWQIDRSRSLMVGDQPTDMAAGAAAGVKTQLFAGGNLFDQVGSLLIELARVSDGEI